MATENKCTEDEFGKVYTRCKHCNVRMDVGRSGRREAHYGKLCSTLNVIDPNHSEFVEADSDLF